MLIWDSFECSAHQPQMPVQGLLHLPKTFSEHMWNKLRELVSSKTRLQLLPFKTAVLAVLCSILVIKALAWDGGMEWRSPDSAPHFPLSKRRGIICALL